MSDDLMAVDAEEAPVVDQTDLVEEEISSAEETSTPTHARLVVKRSGAETDVVFSLNPPSVIGRFDPAVGPIDVDLASLPEGAYVSRKHAKITLEDGAWMIQDLGSSNGTFVLGDSDFERVEMSELANGTEFALGNARFVFYLDEA